MAATQASGGLKLEMPPGYRRLPVYLLLDTSLSMEGPRILSLNEGVKAFIDETMTDPQAKLVTHIAVITISSEANLVTKGLIPLTDFKPPKLVADGVTRLDKAFEETIASFDQDLKKPVRGGGKGDYRPVIFVLTDGESTDEYGNLSDNWITIRDELINRSQGRFKPSSFVAVGCGPDISPDFVSRIVTGPGIKSREELTPDEYEREKLTVGISFCMGDDNASFVRAFRWLSQSLSQGLGNANQNNGVIFDSDPLAPIP